MLINDFSLAQITDDYLAYLGKLEQFPLRDTADFILVASTLVLLKSRSLLPALELTEEEEEDTPRPDAGTPSGGCSGSYTCVIAGDPVEFPLVSKGGKCTANGLTLEDGVVFDANNDPIGTFSAGSMTIQGTVCPRSK